MQSGIESELGMTSKTQQNKIDNGVFSLKFSNMYGSNTVDIFWPLYIATYLLYFFT